MPVAVKRKEQILGIAGNFFRERGYAATSMRHIARKVGVEPASLYSHFKSKDEILQYICFRIADEFFEMQEPILNSMSNPVEKLKRLVTGHINVIIHNLEAASVFFNEWCYLKKPELKKFIAMRERYEKGFHDVIQQGITSGDFRMTDTNFTVRLLFSVMNGVHEWYKTSGKVTPDEAGEKMSEFILEGLAIK
ncbi:MAG TPA: TetR/AcrR family transcriptional regulator [Chitinophagales bacterium]|nr:TetR/AcrR family transcriptional regulator [Chitinophagales bacterium]